MYESIYAWSNIYIYILITDTSSLTAPYIATLLALLETNILSLWWSLWRCISVENWWIWWLEYIFEITIVSCKINERCHLKLFTSTFELSIQMMIFGLFLQRITRRWIDIWALMITAQYMAANVVPMQYLATYLRPVQIPTVLRRAFQTRFHEWRSNQFSFKTNSNLLVRARLSRSEH